MIIIWDPAVLQCDSRTSDLGVLCVTAELMIQPSYYVTAELLGGQEGEISGLDSTEKRLICASG